MALVLLSNNGNPHGVFDGYDGLASTMLGGEVATLVAYDITGSDLNASDVKDGYVISGAAPGKFRPVVTTAPGASSRPLFLTDDGTGVGYATLFGTLVGGVAGQQVSGGAQLGPSTMAGSGKVTLWSNPGLYGVTLDAVDTSADGLVPTNSAITVGMALAYQTADGKLTPDGSGTDGTTNVARFVEFSTGDSLVTTPRHLTRLGITSNTLSFKYAVIHWNPPV